MEYNHLRKSILLADRTHKRTQSCVRAGSLGLAFVAIVLGPGPLFADGDGEEVVAEAPVASQHVDTFLRDHCIRCHGREVQEGELRLDNLPPDFTQATAAAKWIEVMDRLNLGEMPPSDEPRPDVDDVRAVASWIANELRRVERESISGGGRVLLRRMNRAEYVNTVRDLLKVEFLPSEDPTEILPPDGTAEGFDKVSAALMLDPSLLDNYFTVAQQVAKKAIVDGPPPYETKVMRLDFEPNSQERTIKRFASEISTIVREHDIGMMGTKLHLRLDLRYPETNSTIPIEGKYCIRIRAAADRGQFDQPLKLHIAQQHPVESLSFDHPFVIDAPPGSPEVYETIAIRDPESKHWRIEFPAGQEFGKANPVYWHTFRESREAGKEGDLRTVLRLQARKKLEGGHDGTSPDPVWADPSRLPKVYIDWIEVEGPLYDQWPPKSHELLMSGGETAGEDVTHAREIFKRLLPHAFRRPVESDEVEPFVKLVAEELDRGASFPDAIRFGLSAVLTSPAFIYIHESSSSGNDHANTISQYELASRLSYFLWSSMPDAELFELAEAGQLSDPEVLDAQVDRMLADAKAEAFVHGFGGQWLRTHEFRKFMPDDRLYPDYSEELGEAMVAEALAFFREILQNDHPVDNFIDSQWTMLNESLALFYGIDGVTGEAMRPVNLPVDSHRGGLLGMAGVAMWGSDGNRTKPVSRAVYVREVLFNDPPDPPPPNAGEIEPNIEGENLSVRERLLQHQKIASCAACHRALDPYGIALENFNAIGRWRQRQDGEGFRRGKGPTIDPSGKLPNGETFETFDEFKALLLAQRDRLTRGLAEKMLVYALGRPVEASDRTLIDELALRMSRNRYTLRSLIKGLVLSEQFVTK